ncbi:MAG TPA: G8 domain-containing protein, partial [Burkholderiaceae bacterium]|nr:G8 domain-containing protein [Burkholderiaceae bacterium]
FLEYLSVGAPPAPATLEVFPGNAERWSDATAWGDRPPGRGDAVTVTEGRTLVIDQDVDIGSLTVHGTVIVARRDATIRAGWILVSGKGALIAGTAEQPFKQRLTITLCAESGAAPHRDLGSKFLAAVNGGSIDLHGEARASWVPLGLSAAPGYDTVQLDQPVDWRPGERIAVASGADHAVIEERTIAEVAADCLTIKLTTPLTHRHHGRQAVVRHVLPGSLAKAVLLSRNVVVEGCDASERDSVGAYCLIAGGPGEVAGTVRQSIGRFSGVEFRRMGQFNRPGRYPLHWHDNGEATESSVVGCLVHRSYQRGIVTVGSRRVRISGNVVVKPYGHGFIVEAEDDSPQLVTTNLALRPRVARFADQGMRRFCEHRPRPFWIVQSGPRKTLH